MATILLADDYAPSHRILQFVLEHHGYTVIVAYDGEEALKHLAAADVDLIITDLAMPTMDGIAFVREVRGDERYRDIPIIIVTASGSGLDQVRAAGIGVNVCLTKPIDSKELVREVDRLITEKASPQTRLRNIVSEKAA